MFFKKKQLTQEEIELDLKDRLVEKYIFTLTLITGEEIEFESRYIRVNRWTRGIKSYIEYYLLSEPITIENVTYNNKQIVKVERELIARRYIKKEIKDYMDTGGMFSPWDNVVYAKEEDLEDI